MCTTSKIHHHPPASSRSVLHNTQLSGEQQLKFAALANAALERRKAKRYIDRIFYKRGEKPGKTESEPETISESASLWAVLINYFSDKDHTR